MCVQTCKAVFSGVWALQSVAWHSCGKNLESYPNAHRHQPSNALLEQWCPGSFGHAWDFWQLVYCRSVLCALYVFPAVSTPCSIQLRLHHGHDRHWAGLLDALLTVTRDSNEIVSCFLPPSARVCATGAMVVVMKSGRNDQGPVLTNFSEKLSSHIFNICIQIGDCMRDYTSDSAVKIAKKKERYVLWVLL